jgi:drug/metabolite transporter (DMT)-like permease
MGILLGLMAAVGWGTGDLLARQATRNIGSYSALFFAQFIGFIGLTIYLLGTGELYRVITSTSWQPWAWAITSVICNIASSFAIYRAFEVGILTIVSPLAASYAAITVILSMLNGETFTSMHGWGLASVFLGMIIVSTPIVQKRAEPLNESLLAQRKKAIQGIVYALIAAIGYGVTFWMLGFHVTPQLGGLTPVWLVRMLTPCLLGILAPIARQKIQLPRGRGWWYIAVIGFVDTLGYLAYTFGTRMSQVSIVTILSSLYSAVTVILAWLWLRESIQKSQWLGISIIFLGIILVNL